ncbi:MAG: HAMP domain-containing sensor histidine kinase [Vulcanimicrobiota bacterium]
MRKGLLGGYGASLACLVALLWWSPPHLDRVAFWWLLVIFALLESTSVRLPVLGRWSAGWALMLGAAAHTPSLLAMACFLWLATSLVALGLRWEGATSLPAWLEQLLPLSLAAALLAWIGANHLLSASWAAACAQAAYILTWLAAGGLAEGDLTPEARQTLREGRRGVPTCLLACAAAGWCFGLLFHLDPFNAWPIALCCVALQQAVRRAAGMVSAWEFNQLNRQLHRLDNHKSELHQNVQNLRKDLQVKLDERVVLEELSARLSREETQAGAAGVLLEVVRRILTCQTQALFVPTRGGWLPLLVHGPHEARLREANLSNGVEPLVDQAAAGSHSWRRAQTGSPLFPDEKWALALNLAGYGVLYLGHSQAWPEERNALLQLVVPPAAVALWRTGQSQARLQALEVQRDENTRLHTHTRGVHRVLQEIQAMLADLDPQSLIQQLPERLARIVPGFQCCALVMEGALVASWPQGCPDFVLQLSGEVCQTSTPLWLEDLAALPQGPPGAVVGAALVAPLPGPGGLVGAIYLGLPAGAGSQQELQWLSIFAFLYGGLLQSSRLHGELVSAFEQLQLSQAQVMQASKMAAVGQLGAGIAHEINNPLASIKIAIESSLQMSERPNVVRKLLEQAKIAADRAGEIVSKLLYYSREATLGSQQFDLRDMLLDTVKMVARQLELEKVKIQVQPEQPSVPVRANQNAIHQVFLNLLLNARDATLEADSRAPIEVRYGGQPDQVWFEVEDHGCGMTPEVLERCQEPFYTTKPVGRGTGLGLSVSHEIVQKHAGTVEIESQKGRGTRIRVTLPALTPED